MITFKGVKNYFMTDLDDDYPSLYSALGEWANYQMGLEKYYDNKYIKIEEDKDFLSLLGSSVQSMNRFNSDVITKLRESQKDDDSFVKQIRQYSIFHNDLILSKIKHFFFKEVPLRQENKMFIEPQVKIYDLGKRIIRSIDKIAKAKSLTMNEQSEIKEIICKHYLYVSMLYEFIYNNFTRGGIFLHFKFSQANYLLIAERVKGMSEKINDEIGFRLECYDLYPDVLDIVSGINTSHLTINQRFEEIINVIHRNSNDIPALEPLTWRTLSILWKVSSLLQDAEEFISEEDGKLFVVDPIRAYITDCLQNYKSYYDKGRIKYDEIFDAEIKLINKLHKRIENSSKNGEFAFHHLYPRDQITNNFEIINKEFDKKYNGKSQAKQIDITDKFSQESIDRLLSIFNNQIESLGYKLKLENIIETLDGEQLSLFLSSFVESVLVKNGRDIKCLVGVLSSGVTLAHIYNLFMDQLDNPVWSFRVFPYVAIQPLHYHPNPEDRSFVKDLIVFDENTKTGFTSALFEVLAMRYMKFKSISMHSLFNFKRYGKIQSKLLGKNLSLFEENDGLLALPRELRLKLFNSIHHPKIGNWLAPANQRDFKELYAKLYANNRFDTSYILCNTRLALSLCKAFAEEIKKSHGGRDILLYSPSKEARVLLLLTAILLRLEKYPLKLDFTPVEFQSSKYYNVSIDISENTQFTINKSLSTFLDVKLVRKTDNMLYLQFQDGAERQFSDFFNLRLRAWDKGALTYVIQGNQGNS